MLFYIQISLPTKRLKDILTQKINVNIALDY